jgi:hypothetical protein
MVQFAEVLSQVSADLGYTATANKTVRVNTTGWDSWLKADADEKSVVERIAQTYVLDDEITHPNIEPDATEPDTPPVPEEPIAAAPEPPPPPSPAPLDLAAELSREHLISLSDHELRALRRRLARRVHPDLPNADHADLSSMVMVNVAIDAALRRRRPNLR